MKLHLELEVSPLEVRKMLGLPDVEQLQRDIVDAIRDRMMAGVEGFDPVSVLRSFFSLADAVPGFDVLQKILRQAVAPSSSGGGSPAGSS